MRVSISGVIDRQTNSLVIVANDVQADASASAFFED